VPTTVIRFGVLALQGDFAAHITMLTKLGVATCEVRRISQLDSLDGLVVPGGESTTLLHLMRDEPWFDALRRFHARGGVLFGTCAGAILLAREVKPEQQSLGLLDVVIERNAFGRQIDSFETRIAAPDLGAEIHAVFIRAPRIRAWSASVEVLARLGEEPVLVRQGRVLAATFHPELSGEPALHACAIELCRSATLETAGAESSPLP
jgi:5'-phosphate synthase pdxT subunit